MPSLTREEAQEALRNLGYAEEPTAWVLTVRKDPWTVVIRLKLSSGAEDVHARGIKCVGTGADNQEAADEIAGCILSNLNALARAHLSRMESA